VDWENASDNNHDDKRALALSVIQEIIAFICKAADEYKQTKKRKKEDKDNILYELLK